MPQGQGDLYPPRMRYSAWCKVQEALFGATHVETAGSITEISAEGAAGASCVEDDRKDDKLLSDADDASSSSQRFSERQRSKSV